MGAEHEQETDGASQRDDRRPAAAAAPQRECADVVTQIAAAAKALEQLGFKLVASGLTYCLAHPDEAAKSGYDPERVEKMFMEIG